MRLNVFLQRAGIGSRREAERFVAEGRVTINGKIASPTDPIEETDKVTIDGKHVTIETRPVPRLFMLHKPVNVLSTTYDSQGRMTLFELPALNPPLWKNSMPRVMNVGRLDVNSEGLIMLSSDGPLAQTMMHPSTALKRVYRVRVRGRLGEKQIQELGAGVTIDGVSYRGANIVEEKEPTGANTWYQVILTEGKNREIRRLMEHYGCVVNRLIRLEYGPFKLGDLKPGQVREVPQKNVERFMENLRARDTSFS